MCYGLGEKLNMINFLEIYACIYEHLFRKKSTQLNVSTDGKDKIAILSNQA